MDLVIGAVLFGSGLAGGIANALAGGATLITFPVMLAAGLPPILANASNAVAVSPGCFAAAYADRHAFPPANGRMVIAILCALLGGATGVALLLVTPEQLFTLLVPALVGIATGIFAFADRRRGVGERGRILEKFVAPHVLDHRVLPRFDHDANDRRHQPPIPLLANSAIVGPSARRAPSVICARRVGFR
jgi:uncharacterized membrane protein YfcA